jgi:hypothetical protein
MSFNRTSLDLSRKLQVGASENRTADLRVATLMQITTADGRCLLVITQSSLLSSTVKGQKSSVFNHELWSKPVEQDKKGIRRRLRSHACSVKYSTDKYVLRLPSHLLLRLSIVGSSNNSNDLTQYLRAILCQTLQHVGTSLPLAIPSHSRPSNRIPQAFIRPVGERHDARTVPTT